MIPIGMEYTAKLRGMRPKFVSCEACGLEYVYFVERSATAKDSNLLFLNPGAKKSAERRAEKELNEKLDEAEKAIPCPGCGHVQKHMFAEARRRRFGHALGLAKAATFGGGSSAAFMVMPLLIYFKDGTIGALVTALVYGPLAVLAFCWGVRKWIRTARIAREYDPNSEELAGRLERGREEAIPKDVMMKRLAESKTGEGEPDPE